MFFAYKKTLQSVIFNWMFFIATFKKKLAALLSVHWPHNQNATWRKCPMAKWKKSWAILCPEQLHPEQYLGWITELSGIMFPHLKQRNQNQIVPKPPSINSRINYNACFLYTMYTSYMFILWLAVLVIIIPNLIDKSWVLWKILRHFLATS